MVAKKNEKPVIKGRVGIVEASQTSLPKKGKIARYIVTCAQNNTAINLPVWDNLMVLAKHYDAEIIVSRFTYDKSRAGSNRKVKPNSGKDSDHDKLWYAPEINDYVCDKRVQLAPGLLWCGEVNILPTASRPLSGFEAYTGRQSGIFPHVKLAMESIASGKNEPTKFNYTTGTVTQRNYIQQKAGQKAEFHHCYGGLLVEVDSTGAWWVRQLNADSEGTIHDWDIKVEKGKLTTGNRVEGINWGDIHSGENDPVVAEVCWGEGGILDQLKSKHQFMHDLLNFHSRNHHERKNPHKLFEQWVLDKDDVGTEIEDAARLLKSAHRDWCKTIVVDSNHDRALERWLREGDYRTDPVNALFFLKAQSRKYEALIDQDKDFHLLEWAIKWHNIIPEETRFLREDESFVLCRDRNGGIECGMHGHLGINGARGSAASFAKMGRKANVGHTHSAGIHDGIYTSGTASNLDLGYNRGPSSWSHSLILTYANGKRAIITIWHGRAKA